MATYQLVIAEKPSVALSIAKVIGAVQKRDGYQEGDGYLVSWCFGHLVGAAPADHYDQKYSAWRLEDLPILPEPWQFTVPEQAGKQFAVLKNLMEREDVTEIIEATDAGREGELIFRLVYEKAGCRKPVRRLWISSMEDAAIRKGFGELKDGREYDSLYRAALCRLKADWLVGINATRLFTSLYRGKTLNVGRVMTPTLALLAEREQAVEGFKKEKFYSVALDFGEFQAAGERIRSRTDAEKLKKVCMGKPALVTDVTRQEKKEKPPKLYDLTTLQREANRIYGYTAQQTLDYLQSLYEKKLATYPRTDSRFLTEETAAGVPDLCRSLAEAFPFGAAFPGKVDAGQVTDSTKVSDHHGILPTKEAGKDMEGLPTGEKNILSLITMRLLCAVCPEPYVYADASVTLSCAENLFSAKGHTESAEGWKAVERAFLSGVKKKAGEDAKDAGKGKQETPLPEMAMGQSFYAADVLVKEGTTAPPQRYTEDLFSKSEVWIPRRKGAG